MDVRQLQAVQSTQIERIQRLEKRHQDDAAMRSAWSNSPFPSALVGTPQHGPIRIPSTENFDLDEQSQTLGSLHLEPDDEPIRRAAAASRANSVRFDESANLAQSGRSFGDIGPFRPGSSLMMERSLSHKSDGRHSSAGHSVHSVHSVASGRGSSIALDTNFMTGGHEQDSPIDVPEPPPVFFVLGSVPAIIRCWLTKDFANNTLLYAAVCTGAQKSTIDISLVKELGLGDLIYREVDSSFKIHLQTYLAEAIPATKSADPVPQIPFLAINFEIVGTDHVAEHDGNKGIRIFIGSDALRAHSADILFSRNLLSVYSSEREKLSVPFVRPENDALFKNLCTVSIVPNRPKLNATAAEFVSSDAKSRDSIIGGDEEHPEDHLDEYDDDLDSIPDDDSRLFQDQQDQNGDHEDLRLPKGPHRLHGPGAVPADSSIISPGAVSPTSVHPIPTARWNVATSGAPSENGADGEKLPRNSTSSEFSTKETNPNIDTGRRDASAIWGSWRQGGSTTGSDGGHRENGPLSGYQPAGRPRAMKVLKPKVGNGSTSARTGASYEPPPPPRTSGEHRRKSQGPSGTAALGNEGGNGSAIIGGGSGTSGAGGTVTGGGTTASNVIRWESKRSISSNNATGNSGHGKENKGQQGLAALELRNNTSSAPRTSNPVGGASAFAWMKSSKPKTPSAAE
ncbi:hypothetical protein SEUCBS140593_005257 [Sporothrix eucalyptigena]|uniref:Ubiquitin carboxyl-terminal hydrolase 19 n=1 Tax=Sporothrix eucalyptigena TaxID=1812306 RepID=A0ABP0BVR4_9PEZI